MSVREALRKIATMDQDDRPLPGDLLWNDPFDWRRRSMEQERVAREALAALREQAGVEKVARAIFAGRYGPGNEALWKIERWSYERDARAALRALGLEDA